MKGSALLETMTAQVVAECDTNRSKAQQEADAIMAEARDRSKAAREAALAANEREMAHLDERWKQMAHAEASRADLVVKSDSVNAVVNAVRSEIRRIVAGPEFNAVLDALLTSLMREASGDIVVVGPASHLNHVKDWLSKNGHGSVPVESAPELWDGVAVQDPARSYRISNTLTGRFGRVSETARTRCMTAMFGEGA